MWFGWTLWQSYTCKNIWVKSLYHCLFSTPQNHIITSIVFPFFLLEGHWWFIKKVNLVVEFKENIVKKKRKEKNTQNLLALCCLMMYLIYHHPRTRYILSVHTEGSFNPNLPDPVNFVPFGTMRYSPFDINLISITCILFVYLYFCCFLIKLRRSSLQWYMPCLDT